MRALDLARLALRAAGTSFLLLGLAAGAAAQAPAAAAAPEPTPAPDPYQEAIHESAAQYGLLNLYEKQGRVLCELRSEQLNRVYLMFPAIKEGIAQGMLVSGLLYWDQHWTVSFRRVGQKIQFLRLNTRFRASADAQLQRVVDEGYGHSVLAALDIVAENVPAGTVLVDLSGVFFQDLVGVGASLGEMFGVPYQSDPARTFWGVTKVFPRNVELDVRLTFATGLAFEMNTVPDSRSVPITMRYSLVEPPGPGGFRPRLLDDRVGYYYSVLRDMSLPGDEEPFLRYLHRWPLEKANPKAERSAPRQPIVFYLDRSIPYRFRPAVRRGILEWNKAFEAIGIIDAIEVRFQPEDADWDAEDMRYSTVRWSADAAFSGFGPVRVDPRTGQIVDSDVLVHADLVRGYSAQARLYGIPGPELRGQAPRPAAPGRAPPCLLAEGLTDQIGLGLLSLFQQKTISLDEFLDAAIKALVMHEIGHALGLYHNFKGSSATPLAQLHNAEWTRVHGLSGSVMDYPPVNVAPPGVAQGEYFPSTIGPYDYWAIEYGYRPIPSAATTEDELPELKKIADRSDEPSLAYGGDEDLYRWAYEDADPYTNIFDLSSEPLDWAMQRMDWVAATLSGGLEDRMVGDGQRFQQLRKGVASLLTEYARNLFFASRYIGGYEVTRVHKGQADKRSYLRPVSQELQRRALAFIEEVGFDDSLWSSLPPALFSQLAPETWTHWGMSSSGQSIDFPLQQYLLIFRAMVLDRALSATVQLRVLNAELAVAEDPFTVVELTSSLQGSIWQGIGPDVPPVPETEYISRFRRDLQRHALGLLVQAALARGQGPLSDGAGLARAQLQLLATRIDDTLAAAGQKLDLPSLAHLKDCKTRIERALQAGFELRLPR